MENETETEFQATREADGRLYLSPRLLDVLGKISGETLKKGDYVFSQLTPEGLEVRCKVSMTPQCKWTPHLILSNRRRVRFVPPPKLGLADIYRVTPTDDGLLVHYPFADL